MSLLTRPAGSLAGLVAVILLVTMAPLSASLAAPAPLASAVPRQATAATFTVASEGVTRAQAATIAKAIGAKSVGQSNGAVVYATATAGLPPVKSLGAGAGDQDQGEKDGATSRSAVDFDAIAKLDLLTPTAAQARMKQLLASPTGWEVSYVASQTVLEKRTGRSSENQSFPIETTVTARFSLDGIPVVGSGAKQRIAFGKSGQVTSLISATRAITRDSAPVAIIAPSEAQRSCERIYGEGVTQYTPRLVYYAPPLTSKGNTGKGTVKKILPQYACVTSLEGAQEDIPTGALVPAILAQAPQITLTWSTTGEGTRTRISAKATVSMSTDGSSGRPVVTWTSGLADLSRTSGSTVSFTPAAGRTLPDGSSTSAAAGAQFLSATVSDVNGQTTTVTADLTAKSGSVTGQGGGRGGALKRETGIDLSCCDTWDCAEDSVRGFRDGMKSGWSSSVNNYYWLYANAWEADFKSSALAGGLDSTYLDTVDAGWYTGHGSPGRFTFDFSSTTDTRVVPADAQWGDRDLEWLFLQSCQVLQDTSATPVESVWGPAFDGLHILNGFDTNASCGDGTFGSWVAALTTGSLVVLPALPVVTSWGTAASVHDASGHVYVSMAPYASDGATTLNDYIWGKGAVGDDIDAADIAGYYVLKGTV